MENIFLKNKVNILTNALAWFMRGMKILKTILRLQKCSFDKDGVLYSQSNCEKYYKNFFVKAFKSFL